MPPKLSSGMLPWNYFTLLFILCLRMCVSTHMPQYACKDQRTTYRNWLSPTMWVPRTKVRSSDLATGVFIRLATSATLLCCFVHLRWWNAKEISLINFQVPHSISLPFIWGKLTSSSHTYKYVQSKRNIRKRQCYREVR